MKKTGQAWFLSFTTHFVDNTVITKVLNPSTSIIISILSRDHSIKGSSAGAIWVSQEIAIYRRQTWLAFFTSGG
jgi:hypothetical protein